MLSFMSLQTIVFLTISLKEDLKFATCQLLLYFFIAGQNAQVAQLLLFK